MKKLHLPTGIMLMLFLFARPVDAKDYGKEWLNLPKWVQRWYVNGFVDGYKSGHTDGEYVLILYYKDHKEQMPNSKFEDLIDHMFKFHPKVLHLDYGVIADIMTRFYKNSANGIIETSSVCDLAIDKLKGAKKEDIDDRLETLRTLASMRSK